MPFFATFVPSLMAKRAKIISLLLDMLETWSWWQTVGNFWKNKNQQICFIFWAKFCPKRIFSKKVPKFFSQICSIFDETNDYIKFFEKYWQKCQKIFFLRLKISPGHRKIFKNFQILFSKIDPKPIYLWKATQYEHHPRKNFAHKVFFIEIPLFQWKSMSKTIFWSRKNVHFFWFQN